MLKEGLVFIGSEIGSVPFVWSTRGAGDQSVLVPRLKVKRYFLKSLKKRRVEFGYVAPLESDQLYSALLKLSITI